MSGFLRRLRLPLAAAIGASLSSCSWHHAPQIDPRYQAPNAGGAIAPLRVGLVLPPAAAMPAVTQQLRCAFGRGSATVDYAEQYSRLAYQTAAQRFRNVELVADKAQALGRYDALVEFLPPAISMETECGIRYVVVFLIFPLFTPVESQEVFYSIGTKVRLSDADGNPVVDAWSRSTGKGWGFQDAISSSLQEALASMTGSPYFITFQQGLGRARVQGPEREADAAAKKGSAAQALRLYVQAYRAATEDPASRERVQGKLFDLARLMQPPPEIPAEAQDLARKAESMVRMASDERGFAKAAESFEAAADAAPWWADLYYNLGLAREKTRDYAGAARAFRLYLRAAPDSSEADGVRTKISDMEAALELRR